MSDNKCRWFTSNQITTNIESKDELYYFQDEKIISCQIVKLFFFSEKRNSYGNEYEADNGIHINFQSIKKIIESQRRTGSYFEIREILALALSGVKTSVVLVPFRADDRVPFWYNEELQPIEKNLDTLSQTSEYINQLCKNSLNFFYTDNENLNGFSTPQNFYKSMAYQGSYYYLDYFKPTRKRNQDISYILNIFNLLHQYLSKLYEKRQQEEWERLVKTKQTN